jgi:transcriptional regulator GlxA family with amidase domain
VAAPIDVYFVLTPRFLTVDFAGPAEAFHYAVHAGADFRLRYLGAKPSLRSGLGLAIGELEPLPDALPDGALVFVCGAMSPLESYRCAEARATVAWLRRVITPRQRLACVCSAALLAAEAGILNRRQCTTHHTLLERLRQLAPNAQVLKDRVFVSDGHVATSAGVTAGLDLALHLVEEFCGAGIAQSVAREMVVWLRRTDADPQLSPWLAFRNHMHPAVHRVQDAISRAPERGWTLAELAQEAHSSVRNLTRLFRRHAGTSIVDYQQRIRVAQARQLLKVPSHSVERVAELVGFSSSRSLRRVYARIEGSAPRERPRQHGATPSGTTARRSRK